MKIISHWAKGHIWQARLLLVLSHLLLICIAVYWAFLGFKNGIYFQEEILYALLVIYFLLYIFYPAKKSSLLIKNSYQNRTLFHAAMGICSFALVLSFANMKLQTPGSGVTIAVANTFRTSDHGYKNPEAERLINGLKNGSIRTLSKNDRQILRSELKFQKSRYRVAKKNHDKREMDSSLLLILSVFLAVVLFFAVSSLACNLSCNGNEGAAVAVFVLGTALIIFGLIRVFRSARRRKRTTS